jgi:four helix bundle protein
MSEFGEQLKLRTKEFALRIITMSDAPPRNNKGRVLGQQVLRSGTSIGANYREAYRSRSKAEFLAKVGDSLKEAEETAYWLELIEDGKLLSAKRLAPLRDECSQLIAILVTIRNKGIS